jgi:uncharacterized protein (TIGR02996 family)
MPQLVAHERYHPVACGAAMRAIEARASTLADADAAVLAAWTARLVGASEIEQLWAEVAAHPDSDEPRTVLADALGAAGDNRGEYIELQIAIQSRAATTRHDRRALRMRKLVAAEWNRWMGPIATVLVRNAFTMRAGILDTIVVGTNETRALDWLIARGHREFACVTAVRPSYVRDQAEYGKFLAALPRLRSLQITDSSTVAALHGIRLPITRVEYAVRYQPPQFLHADVIAALALAAPDVVDLAIDAEGLGAQLQGIVSALPSRFPRLASLEVRAPAVWEIDPERIARQPLVRLVPRTQAHPNLVRYTE